MATTPRKVPAPNVVVAPDVPTVSDLVHEGPAEPVIALDQAAPVAPSAAGGESAATVRVAHDGEIRTYPDATVRFEAHRLAGGVLLGRWTADRVAADLLSRARWLASVPVWCYLDEQSVAYLVEYTRKPRARAAQAKIIGAVRYEGKVAR